MVLKIGLALANIVALIADLLGRDEGLVLSYALAATALFVHRRLDALDGIIERRVPIGR